MTKLFISHSSEDDEFVRDLRAALADHGLSGWIDSRELRGGDPPWPEIQEAIEASSAYAIVISIHALQSKWVGKELRHALALREQRGKDEFPVIPLSLNGMKLGVLEEFFTEEPIYIPVSSAAGGVEAAMNALLVAMGERLPADVSPSVQPKAQPLEELVLELTDLKFHDHDGVRRASARARLIYEPATLGQPDVHSQQQWRLVAPIGPIESEELRWYLEKYAIWPSHYFRDRARRVEEHLPRWGQFLYEAAMPVDHTANVMNAWARIDAYAGRRFSVYVDSALEAGAPDDDVKTAREAATLLLSLPWELLHDGHNYLFQGAMPVRVRRRLPNFNVLDMPVVAAPLRILLVTARPEDDACSYFDHRASALPLVETMESLPGLVKIHVLSPPTLPALHEELDRALYERKPYHVVHFDGHGLFNREVGLGGLCFEHPEDTGKLEKRRHVTVVTNELGPLLRDHRISLVFLEACQTAQAGKASESVTSELLKIGVASVVAMSHSVLVETARRFVEAFYGALARGQRVGDAMLAGQRELKDDNFRGRILGAGELRLEDWFVPVLYQEKDDPQLFKVTPAKQTQEDFKAALARRLGDLPPVPETGFIGRSRELLALERLMREERYAVVRGQGGEGKTALAAEFARWMVRSQQMQRAAFVSVETYGNQRAVVDALGKQLVKKDFSAAGDLNEAIQQVERALREQPALLILDKMESVLLPPFMEEEPPEALAQEAREEVKAILAVCERLLRVGNTRVIFTSREALPAPFDSARHRRELHQLDRNDAVKLVERVLNAAGNDAGTSTDAAREEIEQLVDAVHCHARTLALLTPSLQKQGVEATRESLVALMAEMEKNFPGSEKSLLASVELSLRRLSEANRERARALGVFHGGFRLEVLGLMMQWEKADVHSLAEELIETGLATPNPYDHLKLNPALCPYLRGLIEAPEREALTAQWVKAMADYVGFLDQQRSQNTEVAATLTGLEMPNLFALLDFVKHSGDAAATINLATSLQNLLRFAGNPRLAELVAQVRDDAEATLSNVWNHARFEATRTRIDEQLASGRLREALNGAHQLLQGARDAGEQAYHGADYDLAMACWLLAHVLTKAGRAEEALPLAHEAETRCAGKDSHAYQRLRGNAQCVLGDALLMLGRYDQAEHHFRQAYEVDDKLVYPRGQAHDLLKLGMVARCQKRPEEALSHCSKALEGFRQWQEHTMEPQALLEIGRIYRDARKVEAAEDSFLQALAIDVRLGNVAGQADTLGQLGKLYYKDLGRLEEGAAFYRQAADKFVEMGDVAKEGVVRNNLAITLRDLSRFDEARQETRRAITCKAQFGHACEPWKAWAVLADIETNVGNPAACADAKAKAIACYLAYRRDGGENHDTEGRISLAVTESLLADDGATATSRLQQFAINADLPSHVSTYIRVLQAIVDGSRDRTLADAPDLNYMMAAEILFLIETLERG